MGTRHFGDGRHRIVCWVIYAVALIIAAGIGKNYTYTGSYDMALHYDLVHSIAKHWSWPTFHPLPSQMEVYPPLAHYMAAIVGVMLHSPLLGMYAVAAGSMFGCYVLLTRAVSAGSLLATGIALTIVAVGLAIGRRNYAVEGFQTIYNFFYAQMVGDFVFLAFALWLSRSRLNWKKRLLVTAAVTFILGWLYLVTAVQVALTYIVLEGLLLLRELLKTRTFRLVQLTPTVSGVVILPLLIGLHPMFKLMASVSGNDGALPLEKIEHLVPQISLALVVMSLALGLLLPENSRWRKPALFLAVAGGASGCAALAQFTALVLVKAGSNYAVKKYAFANVTLLIFSSAAIVGALIDRRQEVPKRPVVVALISCLAGATALAFLPVSSTPDRVDHFARFQRAVNRFMASSAVPAAARGHIVSKLSDYHAAVNHAETMVDLAMDPNTSLVADQSDINAQDKNPATYAYMTDKAGTLPVRCLVPGSRYDIKVLVKISCVQDWNIAPHAPVVLTDMKFLPSSFVSGWSGNEGSGVWTLGKEAIYRMRFEVAPAPTIRLTFSGPAYIPNKDYVQHVELYVGDLRVGGRAFTSASPSGDVTAEFPSSLLKNNEADVVIKLPDATSPAEQKLSGDTRVIAFFVTSISLDK